MGEIWRKLQAFLGIYDPGQELGLTVLAKTDKLTIVYQHWQLAKQTASELVLRGGGWWSGLSEVGLTILILGLSWFMGRTDITCMRLDVDSMYCTTKNRPLLGIYYGENDTAWQVQKAEVKSKIPARGSYEVYRIVLLAEEKHVPVTNEFTRDRAMLEEVAAKINKFINNPGQNILEIEMEDWGWKLQKPAPDFLIFAFLACLSIYYKTIGSGVTCSLNKTTDTVKIRQARKGHFQVSYPLDTVRGLGVEEYTHSQGSGYRISLILADGRRQPLIRNYSPDRQNQYKAADKIRQFLGLNEVKDLIYRDGNEWLDVSTAISEPELPEGEIVFQGEKRIYRTAKMINSPSIAAWDLEFAHLGFQLLGNLQITPYGAIGRCYGQQNGYSYAYVKEGNSWEFQTTFAGDASLITSTRYFLSDIQSRRIFRNSYPGMGIAQLYRCHQERVQELAIAYGEPHLVECDLQAFAATCDRVLGRMPSNLFEKFLAQVFPLLLS
ncbi:MAG: hypothetical protein AB4352_19510 [Hormoscilla sp.]